MRFSKLFVSCVFCVGHAASQSAGFPLESVTAEGSAIPQSVILDITGLKIHSLIDEAGIERACKNLQESGLFASIAYRYAPGPKGYAVTLSLADQDSLFDATIDVPGADENETWQWLAAKFHRFDRKSPQVDAAQKYLAGQIEQHLGSLMRGQHLIVRMETDLKTGKSILSFQPETLPRVQSVAFSGNQAVTSADLASALNQVVNNQEYTSRMFGLAVELNLRPVYEQRGLYRVRFTPSGPQWADAGVSLSVAITEGEPYRLGNVELIGEDLPGEKMLAAAKLPNGKLANWKQIQEGIWEMEKIVKRTGYYEVAAVPDRNYDDAAHILNLRVRVVKGPLYHFGVVIVTGLPPDLQEKARRMWQPKPGDPYDYAYPNEFLRAFSKAVDFRNFRKYQAIAQKGAGDHVMDTNLVFVAR
jgi:outer membrane translocation and assembly module TamA